ncbi:hypothetical protein L2E82_19664 [Cichorium intybus]|uniref:Uncharacterized protein n=1 Tax=Cichorium intybus TaxID=13427 RepID=A0ACB9FCJ9_CICIN|nr:hypothetical protein L2E82_19664 [Cichorium intybus]
MSWRRRTIRIMPHTGFTSLFNSSMIYILTVSLHLLLRLITSFDPICSSPFSLKPLCELSPSSNELVFEDDEESNNSSPIPASMIVVVVAVVSAFRVCYSELPPSPVLVGRAYARLKFERWSLRSSMQWVCTSSPPNFSFASSATLGLLRDVDFDLKSENGESLNLEPITRYGITIPDYLNLDEDLADSATFGNLLPRKCSRKLMACGFPFHLCQTIP